MYSPEVVPFHHLFIPCSNEKERRNKSEEFSLGSPCVRLGDVLLCLAVFLSLVRVWCLGVVFAGNGDCTLRKMVCQNVDGFWAIIRENKWYDYSYPRFFSHVTSTFFNKKTFFQ